MSARQIVTAGLLAGLVFALQVAMAGLPNIEPVTLLLILYTLYVPKLALPIVFAFILLEGVTYGFGIWWVHYLYVWPLLVALTHLLRHNSSRFVWACFSGAYGLAFGAMCAIPYFLTGGFYAGVSYWVSGIPFDVLHCLGNAALMFFLYKPLSRCLVYIGKSVN
nr:hypothetical protein [uncultured Oscillibacter sp.]